MAVESNSTIFTDYVLLKGKLLIEDLAFSEGFEGDWMFDEMAPAWFPSRTPAGVPF